MEPIDSALQSWSELSRTGVTQREVRHRLRAGTLERVRPGTYAAAVDGASRAARHRRLVEATWLALRPGATISHFSAAVLHDLPLPPGGLDRVWVTRPGRSGKVEHQLHLCRADLAPDEVVRIDGLPVTSLARTGADLSRRVGFDHAVMMLDAVLHAGAPPELVHAAVQAGRGRPGSTRSRAALELADGRSESPAESLSRVVFWRYGLPTPELQVDVHDDEGLIGRGDFGWPAYRVIGEFDGRVKYGRAHARHGDPAEELWREKLREDRLRRAGWIVVRWVWADLARPEVLVARIQRALALGTATHPQS